MDLTAERILDECDQVNNAANTARLFATLIEEFYIYMLDHTGSIDPGMRVRKKIDLLKQELNI